jgi:hypothetical protein
MTRIKTRTAMSFSLQEPNAWHGMGWRTDLGKIPLGTYKNLGMLDDFQAKHERN